MDDIVLNKAEIIERALARVATAYAQAQHHLENNLDAQDIILLNIQRACEASIDLAVHVVRAKALGLPKDRREAFTLLEQARFITAEMAVKLRNMVAFRNIAVHDYRALDWVIVRAVIEQEVQGLAAFANQMLRQGSE